MNYKINTFVWACFCYGAIIASTLWLIWVDFFPPHSISTVKGLKYEYVYFEEAGDCSLYRNSGNHGDYFISEKSALLGGKAAMEEDSAIGYTVYPESLRTRKIYIDE